MARTGSTWLSQLVASTGQLGYPEEYLLDWQGWCTHLGLSRDLRREDYLAYLAQLRVTPNGVFGIKGSCDELTPFFELFPCPPCVWLTRENKVEQAVSWHRAHDLGAWTHLSCSAAGSDPIWSAQRALWFFDEIHRREVKWREIFVSRQIDPLVLTYEAVCRDPLAAVRAIAVHVGWDPRSIERVSSPMLVVRSDASREVCQRLEDLLRVRGA